MAVGPGGKGEDYLSELKKRSKESHVHRQFQLIGLEIADLLGDRAHKSLYIKLAKDKDPHWLLRLAKEVAEKGDVRRKGAYFMALATGTAKLPEKSETFHYTPAKKKKNGAKTRKNAS